MITISGQFKPVFIKESLVDQQKDRLRNFLGKGENAGFFCKSFQTNRITFTTSNLSLEYAFNSNSYKLLRWVKTYFCQRSYVGCDKD